MPHRIRLYESAVLKLYQQQILFADMFGESEPSIGEIARALIAVEEARDKALQAWEAIPVELREGVLGPPPSE